jgi:hypothetical protein
MAGIFAKVHSIQVSRQSSVVGTTVIRDGTGRQKGALCSVVSQRLEGRPHAQQAITAVKGWLDVAWSKLSFLSRPHAFRFWRRPSASLTSRLNMSVPSKTPASVDDDALKAATFQRLHPRLYLERFLAEGVRPDGRTTDDFRALAVNAGMDVSIFCISLLIFRKVPSPAQTARHSFGWETPPSCAA